MPLDVLQPVRPRRRRRRYRLGRVFPLVAVVLAAVVAGLIIGLRQPAPAKAHGAGQDLHPALQVHDPAKPPRLLSGPPLLAGRAQVRILAPEAILVDAQTGRVLWAKRAHQRRPVASLTKIMTALLALHEVPWRSTVTVDRQVTRVPLVREGLRTGEHVRAWKLFYSLLLYSGNDDAAQLAISSAGSQRAFLAQMNEEAQRLGLRDTHFTSPSGVVDKGNYSSAYDIAALTRYARHDARFRRLVRTKRIEVPWAPPTNAKIYVNNNALLSEYPGANGVKTGYTHAAGWCLAASATRHGKTLIAVVLDSENIYADAKTLLDLGFRYD
ncbi:MAG TPA: D-alanyl-D-alanine carboxypeptidase family protein [Gaiellaceae bacterium]|nr:D-alanyl-D-alanine carboxypeptidase family protein [Gaiellaceae bacterium]